MRRIPFRVMGLFCLFLFHLMNVPLNNLSAVLYVQVPMVPTPPHKTYHNFNIDALLKHLKEVSRSSLVPCIVDCNLWSESGFQVNPPGQEKNYIQDKGGCISNIWDIWSLVYIFFLFTKPTSTKKMNLGSHHCMIIFFCFVWYSAWIIIWLSLL